MSTTSHPGRGRLVRSVLAAFILLSCIRAWLGPAELMTSVQAQIPDSGMQRKQLLEEVRRTNRLLLEIKQVLTSHTLNVRVQGADNKGADN